MEDFQTQLAGFSLPYHAFLSCINTVYTLFYKMHMEEVNRLIQFIVIGQVDCCCKEDISKRQSRRELAEERKSKKQRCCSKKNKVKV